MSLLYFLTPTRLANVRFPFLWSYQVGYTAFSSCDQVNSWSLPRATTLHPCDGFGLGFRAGLYVRVCGFGALGTHTMELYATKYLEDQGHSQSALSGVVNRKIFQSTYSIYFLQPTKQAEQVTTVTKTAHLTCLVLVTVCTFHSEA